MPLAGRMKLNTFLALVGATVCVGGASAFIASTVLWPEAEPEPAPEPAPAAEAATAAPPAAAPDLRAEIDAKVMSAARIALPGDKAKDVTDGRTPYKINLYQDEGHAAPNRAKVDLDRDDRWDEKWTMERGSITRKVAPADDEQYTEEYRWDGANWVATVETPAAFPPGAGRPVDRYLVAQAGRDIGTTKVKDAAKSKPFKVNLYQDEGNATLNRAKVDLDRDDKWDEKWTFAGDSISRKVSSGDDENYDQEYTWDPSANAWR